MSQPNIPRERREAILSGEYRSGGLTVEEAVAAYRDLCSEGCGITVSRAAEACGLTWTEMVDALQEWGVEPRLGPDAAEELDVGLDTAE